MTSRTQTPLVNQSHSENLTFQICGVNKRKTKQQRQNKKPEITQYSYTQLTSSQLYM